MSKLTSSESSTFLK